MTGARLLPDQDPARSSGHSALPSALRRRVGGGNVTTAFLSARRDARVLASVLTLIAADAWAAHAPPAPQAPAAQAPAPATPAPAEAPSLGRLFFTPAQRNALDDMRRRTAAAPAVATAPDKPPLPSAPEYVTLNGVVRRSDGTTTVWLNNKPVRAGESQSGLVVAPSARSSSPGNVTVRVPQEGRSVDLKVGQQLEVNSGRIEEAYQAPRTAAAPAQQSSSTAGDETTPRPPRRSGRERDLLRDLLQEIEGPSPGRPGAGSGETSKPPTAGDAAGR